MIVAEIDTLQRHFAHNGIDVLHGTGRFVDKNTVEIHEDGTTRQVTADHFLIGVGTSPTRPDSVQFDGENLITSDQIVKLPYLPHTMIVVGGGVIGTEYASMLAALGVRVTLLEAGQRLRRLFRQP